MPVIRLDKVKDLTSLVSLAPHFSPKWPSGMLSSTCCVRNPLPKIATVRQLTHRCPWLLPSARHPKSWVALYLKLASWSNDLEKGETPAAALSTSLPMVSSWELTESNSSPCPRLLILLSLYTAWIWAQQQFVKAIRSWVGNARAVAWRENPENFSPS